MLKVIFHEWKKIIRHPSVIWFFALFTLFIAYTYISVGFQFQDAFASFLQNGDFQKQELLDFITESDLTEPLTGLLYVVSPSMAITYSLASVNAIGPIILSIIGALLFGIEYQYFTIRQLWVSGRTRAEILLGKIVSIMLFILLFCCISILTGLFMSMITPLLFNLPVDLVSAKEPFPFDMVLLQLACSFLSLLLWSVFSGFIAVICKSLLAGVIVGFVYPIIESSFLHTWYIGQWFPLFIQKSMLPILFEKTNYGGIVSFYDMPDIYSVPQSFLFSFMYLLLFVLLTFIGLKKQRVPMP
ncbi:ABC transporter permease subunit [Bacillaceae bacterium Marseille-Q3522]|nr:ABC transporter permease subunit [Bacillaceae bacterium Marseille-Q3522]